jgi:hypothetical protein
MYLLLKSEDGSYATINRVREASLRLVTDGKNSVGAAR